MRLSRSFAQIASLMVTAALSVACAVSFSDFHDEPKEGTGGAGSTSVDVTTDVSSHASTNSMVSQSSMTSTQTASTTDAENAASQATSSKSSSKSTSHSTSDNVGVAAVSGAGGFQAPNPSSFDPESN